MDRQTYESKQHRNYKNLECGNENISKYWKKEEFTKKWWWNNLKAIREKIKFDQIFKYVMD